MRLGDLEQQVMAVLWGSGETALTVRQVAQRFPDHAYTTLLTILDRLEKKGMAVRVREGRAFLYRAAGSRGDYTAALMREALDSTPDPRSALVRFAATVTDDEAAVLRDLLNGLDRGDSSTKG